MTRSGLCRNSADACGPPGSLQTATRSQQYQKIVVQRRLKYDDKNYNPHDHNQVDKKNTNCHDDEEEAEEDNKNSRSQKHTNQKTAFEARAKAAAWRQCASLSLGKLGCCSGT